MAQPANLGPMDGARNMAERLTARQREHVGLATKGLTNKQIARQLGVTEGTVKAHLHQVYQKLGVINRTALTMRMRRDNLTG